MKNIIFGQDKCPNDNFYADTLTCELCKYRVCLEYILINHLIRITCRCKWNEIKNVIEHNEAL